MKYSIKKDEKPKKTVKKIKEKLEKCGIETEVSNIGSGEKYFSVAVKIKNCKENIETTGKGTSYENSLASGYAEFIEYLQTHFLLPFFGDKFKFDPDEKILDVDFLKNTLFSNHLESLNIALYDFNKIVQSVDLKFYLDSLSKIKQNQTPVVPLVSYKNKKIEYLPMLLIHFLQNSNGHAAGNTFEEACTQALSEIIERYCCKQVFINKISMPNIPKEYYEQYENIIGLIKEIEKLGYKVILKDASLGEGLCAACAFMEDKLYKKNGYLVRFGAHPYLQIAIERTLTEFLQGVERFSEFREKAKYLHSIYSTSAGKMVAEQFCQKNYIKKENKIIKKNINSVPDYEFDENTWLRNENLTNKKLFNKLSKKILEYTDDIYIRNYSFLGFPTVAIYAGEFSNPLVVKQNYIETLTNYYKCKTCFKNKIDFNLELEELFEYFKYIVFSEPLAVSGLDVLDYHFGFLCSVLLDKKKYVKKFLKGLIAIYCMRSQNKKMDAMLHLYQAYLKYFKLYYTNTPKEKIQEIIEKKYSKIIYFEIENFLETLSFEKIEKIFQTNLINKKEGGDTRKDFKSQGFEYDERIKQLGNKLHNIYAKNIPNQNEILKIIEGYKPTIKDRIKNIFTTNR
ncbi:MAG: YcaO-like family protein [Candidatus Gastranaerophilales bacterium]|nr:YcaO-like family protein [Candidatus Gastranaerophilales bacterium]